MQDISDIVGVSKVTISRVFTGRSDVSDSVREQVLKVANELGYRYNPGIRTQKAGNTGNIGVLVPEVFLEPDEVFFTNVLKKFYASANERRYDIVFSVISKDEEESLKLPRVCLENKVDGLAIIGQMEKNFIKEILKYNFPVVLLDFTYDDLDIDSVLTNNFTASYQATRYLIDMGHKRIGFAGNIHTTNSILDRYMGYCKAMIEHGLPMYESNIIKERDDGNHRIEYVLPDKLPSAFVCNSDNAAYLLIKKLQSVGVNVPQQCSVIGFDDVAHSQFSEPKITTMHVPKAQMADYAVDMIITRLKLKKKASVRKIVLDASLIVRSSVAEAPAGE